MSRVQVRKGLVCLGRAGLVTAFTFSLGLAANAGEKPQLTAAEKAGLSARISALKDRTDPQADELRKSIPVPIYSIDIDKDQSLRRVLSTAPGVPQITELGAPPRGTDARQLPDRRVPDGKAKMPEKSETVGDTVFGVDDRWVFHDHNYPYRTVGLVNIAPGWCSGTMVGPRHMLTASHCIVWNGDGSTGWIRFRPSMFNDHSSDDAWATSVFYYKKNVGPWLNGTDIAFDFVVVVLDRYVGNNVGWMGSKTYSNSWNGGAYWANIGYPYDMGSGVMPTWENPCSITSTWSASFSSWTSTGMYSLCDIMQGQSGSPLYGTWDGWPYVIAVTSAESPYSNYWGGGSLLPSIISYAHSAAP